MPSCFGSHWLNWGNIPLPCLSTWVQPKHTVIKSLLFIVFREIRTVHSFLPRMLVWSDALVDVKVCGDTSMFFCYFYTGKQLLWSVWFPSLHNPFKNMVICNRKEFAPRGGANSFPFQGKWQTSFPWKCTHSHWYICINRNICWLYEKYLYDHAELEKRWDFVGCFRILFVNCT